MNNMKNNNDNKQLLEEKENQNYTGEELNKILEIGLSIMEK